MQTLDIPDGFLTTTPNAAFAEQAQLFAPLIGDWVMRSVYIDKEGGRKEIEGTWHFRFGLDGGCVLDQFRYRDNEQSEWLSGMTVRYYDAKIARWRVVYFAPARQEHFEFTAHKFGDGIRLERADSDGALRRWTFTSIRKDGFDWVSTCSRDGGETWTVDQEIWCKR